MSQVTLKELFFDTIIAVGGDPNEAIFDPRDYEKLTDKFVNNCHNTDLDDTRIDVMCWCGGRVYISCSNDDEDGTRIYITSARRNPPNTKGILESVSEQLSEISELTDLSDSHMRDGDSARMMINALIGKLAPFIKD